jgi:hypothetical protein
LFLGSCFSENIGAFLINRKFDVDLNPFGVIFNPASIKKSLEFLIEEKVLSENELFYHNEQWHSFYHHTRFSGNDKESCLTGINQRMVSATRNLKKADFLFLTFGTSVIFRSVETGEVVSNCHKLPASKFINELLTSELIVAEYNELFGKLKKINPGIKIILTISPVRHLGNGVAGNQLSKAILVVSAHELCKHPDVYYFPAYELLLDDLRDYRFYDEDMVHPSKQAVEYIINFFSSSYFDKNTLRLNEQVEKIISAYNHRPVRPQSDSYRQFCRQALEDISVIEKDNPTLDFSFEKMHFRKFL